MQDPAKTLMGRPTPTLDAVEYMAREVRSMKPGSELCVSAEVLLDRAVIGLWIGDPFMPADRVLERIIGSGYEFGYEEDPRSGTISFFRLEAPLDDGQRSYVSPDRRHFYRKVGRLYEWRGDS